MLNKKHEVRYLPIFSRDLYEIAYYIARTLENPIAAENLLNDVEVAIRHRSCHPTAFHPFESRKPRKHTYYYIRVKNYMIFYIVVDGVMEVHRIIYSRRDLDKRL